MPKTIIEVILGGFITTGGIIGIIRIFGQKLLSLLYDFVKEKISIDIEKNKAEFENILTQKLKRLESQLEIFSHVIMTQYDIEVKKYDEISQKLSVCTYSVKKLCDNNLAENEVIQAEKMQQIRAQTLDDAEALKKVYEEAAPFIQKEIYEDLETYVLYLEELVKVHKRFPYGFYQNTYEEMKQIKQKIELCKRSIQDGIRAHLEEFEKIIKEPSESFKFGVNSKSDIR